ncbi:hypothetical protein LEL_07159 [Akanthomyces lecanii RCEF 1005]|uniref:Uncharacterized protein n=1 Tax=Akanthomyces lecanii RCEF 1005 TaxID=1081108 RepID=A0A168FGW5_CORDF|nr:hypothetical protein LEL_07159 [Akanthomyces lecanii RCEF 1005]
MASNAARFPTILGQNHLYSNKNEYYTISTHDTIPCTMNLSYTTFFYIAAHLVVNAIALPVVEVDSTAQLQARAGGGIGDILKDHAKYTTNPPSALEPIPAADNNAVRETHRQAHKTIFEVMTGGAGGNKAGDKTGDKAGDKAGNETAEKGGDKDKPAA